MKPYAALTLSCFALTLVQTSARAQVPSNTGTSVITTRSTLVLVPALVRDKHGNLVFTLTANDFAITDDGIPQKLTLEPDTDNEPLALVVDIEIGGAGTREYERFKAIAPMLDSIVGSVPHRIAVVAFDSHSSLEQDFTSSTDEAAQAIFDLEPGCSRQNHQDDCAPNSVHDLSLGDNGAAILDSIGVSVDLLRKQPSTYRRAILLVSETLDRGSTLKLDDALRAITDTNTSIYSIAFSTGKSEAAHYANRELPTQPSGGPKTSWLRVENAHPNPPHGCMGKDPNPDPDATHNKIIQAYDCLTQLAPPLALAKMAAIDATDSLKRNIPETVANLTGGEYFKLTDAKSLERSLQAISNHIPNRYVLSFQPQYPHPGFHVIHLQAPDYADFQITARNSYWATPDPSQATPSTQPSVK